MFVPDEDLDRAERCVGGRGEGMMGNEVRQMTGAEIVCESLLREGVEVVVRSGMVGHGGRWAGDDMGARGMGGRSAG